MNIVYDFLSTAWKRRLQKKVERRSIIPSTHCKEQDALLEEMDITLLKVQNCAAMNTVYDFLSTAWKRRLQKKAERRSIILSTHCRG